MSLINGMDSIMCHIKNQEILIQKLKVENDRLNNLKCRVDNFKEMLKKTAELEEDEEGWMETWDIIEETLGIDTMGNDIA